MKGNFERKKGIEEGPNKTKLQVWLGTEKYEELKKSKIMQKGGYNFQPICTSLNDMTSIIL